MKKSYGMPSASGRQTQTDAGSNTPVAVNTNPNNNNHRTASVPLAPYPPSVQYGGRYQNSRSATNTTRPYSGSTTTGLSAPSLSEGKSSRRSINNSNNRTSGNSNAVTPSARRMPRAKFCHHDMVATINTVDGNDDQAVLLQLQRLRFASSYADQQQQQQPPPFQDLFELETVAQSVSSSQTATPLASTCLDVASPNEEAPFSPIVTGLSSGGICVHTSAEASTSQPDAVGLRSNYIPSQHYNVSRPVTAVAWQPETSFIAAGWGAREVEISQTKATMASSLSTGDMPISGSSSERGTAAVSSSALRPSSSGPSFRGSGGSGFSGAGGGTTTPSATDLEYGCFLWNVETGTPVTKVAHQVDVASLSWVGSTLVVGGQLRNAYLYDLRAPSSAGMHSGIATIYAHNFSVSGIETDPHRPHQFATYCTVANEPVKLWDARRTDNFVSEIKTSQHAETTGHSTPVSYARSDSSSATAFAVGLQWSHRQPGILSLAIEDTIHDYDTTASRPVHMGSFACNDPIADFCVYPFKAYQDKEQTQEKWMSSLYSRRAIVAYEDRTVRDVPKHTVAPLAISRRDGRLVHGLGTVLSIGSTTTGPSVMESANISSDEDISSRMMRRARLLHGGKYSMDAASNIKMLAEEGLALGQDGEISSDGLLKLWIWIERVESFCTADVDDILDTSWLWPVKGLMDAGTMRILLYVDERQGTQDSKEECVPLSCHIYSSPGRRAALAACGWSGRYDLANIMGECEDLEEYERSAALAVWHGDIGAAVGALQRGASSMRSQRSKTAESGNDHTPARYAEIMDQVALCIAGYRGGAVESDPSSSVWHQACTNLLERTEHLGAYRSSSKVAYMRALLNFLTSLNPENGHQKVLEDDNLSLMDRVGYACRFLSRIHLKEHLKKFVLDCQAKGNIEGLVITGIDKQGIKILQSYVDHYADVQTAALVTSRVILPPAWVHEKRIASEWLHSYRDFLNTLQMWQSRSVFDCDRASLLREVKAKQEASSSTTGPMGGKLKKPKPQLSYDPDVQAPIPAQIDARCNYCGSPLIHRNKDGASIESSLAKMKSVLNCCPTCRKPLPRCSVCLLSLGTINPYQALLSRMSQGGSDDMSSTTNLPFAEWFAWCAQCKHGGHAHHLVGWFANHDVCPVSGCDCRCQFDGIKTLNRPALSGWVNTNVRPKNISGK